MLQIKNNETILSRVLNIRFGTINQFGLKPEEVAHIFFSVLVHIISLCRLVRGQQLLTMWL